jgi:hypothetical protein
MPVAVYAPIEFSTHNPENLIIIENSGKVVIIRAAYDNFSPRRKAFLIRQLAAEGYIPDQFESYSEDEFCRLPGLIWTIDRSLLILSAEAIRHSTQFMQRLIMGSCLLWLLEMIVLFGLR